MPRKPRFIVPGVPVHVVQRGRSREAVFHQEPDYQIHLEYLKEASKRYRCTIHALRQGEVGYELRPIKA